MEWAAEPAKVALATNVREPVLCSEQQVWLGRLPELLSRPERLLDYVTCTSPFDVSTGTFDLFSKDSILDD